MHRYRTGLLKDSCRRVDLLALTSVLAVEDPLFAAVCPARSSEQRTSLPQNAGVERPLLNSVVDWFGSKAVIASVTGTETDPQGFSRQVNTRRRPGSPRKPSVRAAP